MRPLVHDDAEPYASHPLHFPAEATALVCLAAATGDRKSTRLNSSHSQISYAVFCLKKKKKKQQYETNKHQRAQQRMVVWSSPQNRIIDTLHCSIAQHVKRPTQSVHRGGGDLELVPH